MNVLKPEKKATLATLLNKNVSQREISRKAGIDRKTIRKYGRQFDIIPLPEDDFSSSGKLVATGTDEAAIQNPPSRPPAISLYTERIPFHARSACEPHQRWIE